MNPPKVERPTPAAVKPWVVGNHDRRVYKLWEEKVAPCVTIEITSRSSKTEDLGTKKGLYEMLGVREYFIFDPLGEYLEPRFQGFEREGGFFRPMTLPADLVLRSRELDLSLRPEGPMLRLVDPATGLALPTLEEAIEQAEDEARRADAAEAEIALLRAEIEKLRGRTR